LDSIILVGFGQVMMHYAVALITLRGIPSRCIFIIDRAPHVGGCLYGANQFGWFGAPSNPFVFYPFALYGSCYHKMKFDALGVTSPNGLKNMFIIREHFGLRVYLETAWETIMPHVHPRAVCIKPEYRDVISGRSAGATNGLDAVDLSETTFQLVGLGSTLGDALTELIRRRVTSHGKDFQIIIHYRTPRRYTTYLGTILQPPGVHPFTQSAIFSTLGTQVDEMLLRVSPAKYEQIIRLGEEFKSHQQHLAKTNQGTGVAITMNMLLYHPAVASRVRFNRIKDRSEVVCKQGAYLDCTNHTDYLKGNASDHTQEPRVDLQLNMQAFFQSRRALIFGKGRNPGPLSSQWSTAHGAMGAVLCPENQPFFDFRSHVSSCFTQCYAVFYFARFHSIPQAFLAFQFSPTSMQFIGEKLYMLVMHVLAWSGFVIVFFHEGFYSSCPHQTLAQNFSVVLNRWRWFSNECGVLGNDAEFPVALEDLPGVERCYSYTWLVEFKRRLSIRMVCTTLVAAAIGILSSKTA